MRKNPYYRLKYIAGVPYLLTFGQGNADFKHDLRLNETSVFLWEQLEKVSDIEELMELSRAYFQCSQEQYQQMEASVREFVSTLYRKGILLPKENVVKNTLPYKVLEIAGLFFRLYGPAKAFAEELLAFETSKEFPDDSPVQEICVQMGFPQQTENGTLILRKESLSIVEGIDTYRLFFPASNQILETHISKDGKNATIYCVPELTSEGVNEISYAMRICFLYYAQLHGMLAIHSSSILYKEKIWLFSAPSGTGKSTHAQLWQDIVHTPIVNGDLNLITIKDNIPSVHGIPWCGTSGIYDVHTHPLGGVIFLKQGLENQVSSLSEDQKQLYLLHRSISPAWIEVMQERNISMIESLYDKILICRLTCNKEEEAVHCIKKAIDAYLVNS